AMRRRERPELPARAVPRAARVARGPPRPPRGRRRRRRGEEDPMAMTLDGKPAWIGLLIGLLFAGGSLWAMKHFVIDDIENSIHEAESRIAELDKKIEQGRAAERKL